MGVCGGEWEYVEGSRSVWREMGQVAELKGFTQTKSIAISEMPLRHPSLTPLPLPSHSPPTPTSLYLPCHVRPQHGSIKAVSATIVARITL